MLYQFTLAVLFLLAVWIVYEQCCEWLYLWQSKRKGFALPQHMTHSFPLGIPRNIKFISKIWKDDYVEYIRTEFHKEKPTVYFRDISTHFIHTRDPENIKTILASKFGEYEFGPDRFHQLAPLLGSGIFTLSGEGWSQTRSLLRPMFHKENISRFNQMEQAIQVLLGILKDKSQIKEAVDIQQLFYKFTMDTATEFLFGETCDSLSGGSRLASKKSAQKADEFVKAFVKAQDYATWRFILPVGYELVNTKESRQCNASAKKFVDYYVEKAISNKEEYNKSGSDQYSLVGELANATDDPVVIRDQCLNVLLAARDTTAGFLSFACYILACREDLWHRLRSCVLEAFGTGTDEISFQSLKRCDYLRHYINEVLRMYPLVPSNIRVAEKDTTLPRGGGEDGSQPIFVKKGTVIQYHPYALQREESLWGKDANEFRPERWLEYSHAHMHPWAYVPFNGGPRICLGQQLALTEASYVLVRLVQTFKGIHTTRTEGDINTIPMKVRLAACVGGGNQDVPVWFDLDD